MIITMATIISFVNYMYDMQCSFESEEEWQ